MARDYRSTAKKTSKERPDKDANQVLDSTDDKLEVVFDKNGERQPKNLLRMHGVSKRKEKFAIYNSRKSGM